MNRMSFSRSHCVWLCLTSTMFLPAHGMAANAGSALSTSRTTTPATDARKLVGKQKDAVDQLIDRVRAAEKGSQWSEAIKLTEELLRSAEGGFRIDSQRWRRSLGELYTYNLDFDRAVIEFQKVLDGPDSGPGISGNLDKAYASHGLAYARARQGRYADASKWLDAFLKEYPSHCGTCQDSREITDHVLRSVWKAAALGGDKSEAQLQVLADGGLKPVTRSLVQGTEKNQRAQSQREARLVLGEMLLRKERAAPAKLLLEKATHGDDDAAKVAASYLRRIRGQEVGRDPNSARQ